MEDPGQHAEDRLVPAAESHREYHADLVLGVAFLVLSLLGLHKFIRSFCFVRRGLAVVTYFYMLYAICAVTRAVWFLVPSAVLEPSYAPRPVFAFRGRWIGTMASEILLSSGSVALFALFILLIVMWADLLQRLYNETLTRDKPLSSFMTILGVVCLLEVANIVCFLFSVYSSEGMILVDAVLFASASIICVFELTKFSHRIRRVLQTMMGINEVSYENQIFRILSFTVIGNLFFLCRATVEAVCALSLVMFWHRNRTLEKVFNSQWWDAYILVKHWSEVAILTLIYAVLAGSRSQARGVNDTAAPAPWPFGWLSRMYQRWQYRRIFDVDREVHGRQHTYGASNGAGVYGSSGGYEDPAWGASRVAPKDAPSREHRGPPGPGVRVAGGYGAEGYMEPAGKRWGEASRTLNV